MNYKKKTLALLVALPLSLGGCNPKNLPLIGGLFGGGKNSSKNVTLTVWGLWNSEETMKPIFDGYVSQHPNVKIAYEERSVMPLVDYKERVFTRAAEGTQPDVVMAHAGWLPRLISAGVLNPAPSGLFAADYVDSNFFPVVKNTGVKGKDIYSLPSSYDGLVLIYNKKHFEEAGITQPPADWEEFRRDAVALTRYQGDGARRDMVRGGAAIGLADNIDHFSDILGLMFVQASVKVPDGLDTTQAVDAVTFYTNFVKEDGVWNAQMPEAVLAFAAEKTSMILVPTWRVYELLNSMKDPSVIGVAQAPQASVTNPTSWATYWTWVVPKSSINSDESWSLIKYLVDSQTETAIFSKESEIRPFGSIYSNKGLASGLTTNTYLKPAIDTASNASTLEIAGRSGNRRQVDALKTAVNDIISGKPVKDTLVIAKATISK